MIAQALAVSVAMATLASVGAARAMTLTSPDIEPGAPISDEQAVNAFGCPGKNVSPALSWSGAPADAKSFALTLFDPDAPGGGFWHWAIFNIPADVSSLPKGAGDPRGAAAPKGATQSRSDFGAPGYGGPCPPKGDKPHRYQFTVYAVDVDKLDADERASAAAVGRALKLHTLAKATLIGLYGR